MGRPLRSEGVVGLRDRSSRPLSSPNQTSRATADAVEVLRRQRRTQEHIAGELGISKATVAHDAVDDHSRVARVDIFQDQKKESAVAFLLATVAYFKSLGVTVERVMTDNGSCYGSKAFADACKQLGIKHIKIKPYTPQTNGKAERFIQTALREWAYATAFEHSDQRRQALLPWLHLYNWHRPHASLAKKPPISRVGLTRNNLLRLHN